MLISITVLAMEGSGSMQMIVPLMVAVTLAKVVGDALSLPIYDMQIKIRGAPVLVRFWSPVSGNQSFELNEQDSHAIGCRFIFCVRLGDLEMCCPKLISTATCIHICCESSSRHLTVVSPGAHKHMKLVKAYIPWL